MPHNDYVMPAGKWVAIPSPEKLARLDQTTTEGVNGDDGGMWAPSSSIAIGGAGLNLSTGASTFTGGVTTAKGYTSSAKPRIVLGGSKIPTFASARTRKILLHPVVCQRLDGASLVQYTREGALQSVTDYGGIPLDQFIPLPQLRMHNGATVSQIAFRWRLLERPPTLNSTHERFGILRTSRTLAGFGAGNWASMRAGDGGAGLISSGVFYQNGMGSLVYATTDDVFSLGAVKTLTYVPDQNNVIDTDQYLYFGILRTDQKSVFHGIELTLGSINDQRFE